MWEDVLVNMNYSEIKSLMATSKDMKSQISLSCRWKQLEREAEKVSWFCERIKKITDFDLSMLKWTKSENWKDFEILIPKDFIHPTHEVYLSWSKVLTKFCITEFSGQTSRPMPKTLSKDELIDILIPIYKILVKEEKEGSFSRALSINDYKMSMKKSHDLWFYREEFDFELTESEIPVLKEIFDKYSEKITLTFSKEYIHSIYKNNCISKEIKLNWSLFKLIISKTPDIKLLTRVFYGGKPIPYWDAEWTRIHKLHFWS